MYNMYNVYFILYIIYANTKTKLYTNNILEYGKSFSRMLTFDDNLCFIINFQYRLLLVNGYNILQCLKIFALFFIYIVGIVIVQKDGFQYN